MLNVGGVYHDPNFQFSDGEEGNKLFVVLGKDDDFYTVAKTTSQQHERTTTTGCQGVGNQWHSWFHPENQKRCFTKDTWICFNEFYPISKTRADASFRAGLIKVKCASSAIRQDLCKILECALKSEDLNGKDEKRLQAAQVEAGCLTPKS